MKNYVRQLTNDTQYLYNIMEYGQIPLDILKNKKPFTPEIEPQLIDYDDELFKKFFPKDKDINFRNLKMSNIGSYSITDPETAQIISDIIKKFFKDNNITVTDANGNMGGNTINFAQNFNKVNSVEIIPKHCDILKNNITEYKLENKIQVICKDYLDVMLELKQDVVFFDPPWGGKDYKKIHTMNLELDNINIIDIINAIKAVTKIVVIRVPFNYDIVGFLRKVNYDRINIFKNKMKKKKNKKTNMKIKIKVK